MARKEDRFIRRRLNGAYITTIVSIALVLFAIGLLGMLLLHAQKLSDFVKENIAFSVYMNKNAKEADIIQLQKKLDAMDYIKSTEYIDENAAAASFTKILGEDFVKTIGYNPLHSYIEVHLKAEFAELQNFDQIKADLEKNENVKEVDYQRSLVTLVNENVKKISIVLLAFSVLLLIIATTLINNTIRLSVYSKRFLIRSMQLVGATERFIRKPFLITSVVHGLIASLLSTIGLGVVIWFARQEIPDIITLQQIDLFLMLFASVFIIGFIISWISTYFAVRKFLRVKIDYLYY
ncbi:MAG: permease-like cell division protein FtsX [Bacteroidota bacterium]